MEHERCGRRLRAGAHTTKQVKRNLDISKEPPTRKTTKQKEEEEGRQARRFGGCLNGSATEQQVMRLKFETERRGSFLERSLAAWSSTNVMEDDKNNDST